MSVITGEKLQELVTSCSNCLQSNIGFSEVNVKLDGTFWVERVDTKPIRTDALPEASEIYREAEVGVFNLTPGEFVRAQIMETFILPENVMGMFTIRSRYAQMGLDQAVSILLKPNWAGKLILELKNNLRYHNIRLVRGTCIGQIVFFRCGE